MRRSLRRPVTFPLVIVLLAVSVLAPTACVPHVPEGASRTAKLPERKPTGAELFAKATDELTESLALAADKLESGSKATTEVARITEFADALPKLDRGVRSDFAKTRKILEKIDSDEKDAIQAKVEKQYAKRLKTLKSKLADVEDADTAKETATAVASLASWMDEITPDEPHQPLGTELPHRIVDYDAGPPTLGTQIAPAYAPNLADSTPSTLPVTPTSQDITQTIEVRFTDDIRSLATSLGSDPVKMYEYVRNTIDFEPYYGSRKGANETLAQLSGNDMDQASLLIALYRASGIPARYVSGVVDVPIDKAMNWVGVEVPEAAAKLFASAGTPTTSLVSGGKVKALRIEHTWVEAYVPYEDYRGAGEGTGEKLWVPLDPSFKEYEWSWPTLPSDQTYDVESALRSMGASATFEASTGAVSGVSPGSRTDEVLDYCSRLIGVVRDGAIAASDLVGHHAILEETRALLPTTLPVKAASICSERTSVASEDAERVTFSIGGASAETRVAAVASSRLAIVYEAASHDDRQIVSAYGSIYSAPSYALLVRPVLYADGVEMMRGAATNMGDIQTLEEQWRVGDISESFSNDVVAGESNSIVVNTGRITGRHVEPRVEETRRLQAEYASESASLDADNTVGQLLHVTGLAYLAQREFSTRTLSAWSHVVQAKPVSDSGRIGLSVRSKLVLGIPSHTCLGSFFADIDQLVLTAVHCERRSWDPASFMLTSGMISSSLESSVLESSLHMPFSSTMSVIASAAASGTPVHSINEENAERALSAVSLPRAVEDEIRTAVSRGYQVIVPSTTSSLGSWSGCGYIVVDEATGSAGFMVSGGYAGGVGGLLLSCIGEVINTASLFALTNPVLNVASNTTTLLDSFNNEEDVLEAVVGTVVLTMVSTMICAVFAGALVAAVPTGVGAVALIGVLWFVHNIIHMVAMQMIATGKPIMEVLRDYFYWDSCSQLLTGVIFE